MKEKDTLSQAQICSVQPDGVEVYDIRTQFLSYNKIKNEGNNQSTIWLPLYDFLRDDQLT